MQNGEWIIDSPSRSVACMLDNHIIDVEMHSRTPLEYLSTFATWQSIFFLQMNAIQHEYATSKLNLDKHPSPQ